jgi:hypothetical protein
MIVVVVTGNHYWLDGVVAIMVLALAVVFEQWVRGLITRARMRRHQGLPESEAAPSLQSLG